MEFNSCEAGKEEKFFLLGTEVFVHAYSFNHMESESVESHSYST